MEPAGETTAREAVAEAERRGAHPHRVDGLAMPGKAAALDAIARALSFPSYFGRNLDALYDCLTDLSWLPAGEHVLVWSHPEVLRDGDPAGYDGVTATLRDAVAAGGGPDRPLRVVVTVH
ncbi:barstar family protein [Gandjariella thermophila]|uniref:Barstar (barnase inhibitor) domain-containing protein n=1 Tax=Gandjariella thermophila TaxID=1931992 RepID=A0A4D4JAJ8_9PSEU|nr:barstar family protein [Gandjariella thermophila]GDY31429.1 hypothetical protein GTS_30620 [Gandjariella thermophila]